MHRVTRIVVGLEAAALGVYFICVYVADSFLPERGGSGDAKSIFLWNGRAAFSFWLLVTLWLVAVVRVAVRALRKEDSLVSVAQTIPRGADALSVGLPLLGLAVGYVGLMVMA